MKYKKLISILLVTIILFNSLCPISFAAIIFSSGSSSSRFNWKELNGKTGTIGGSGIEYSYLETVEIKVDKSGIYNISNSIDGIPAQFIIGHINKTFEDCINPLRVATYGKDGNSTMDIGEYNNANSRETSVYLKEGETYYISFLSDSAKSLHEDGPSDSEWMTLNVEYIEPKEGEEIYETMYSSEMFTTPRKPLKQNAMYHPNGDTGKEIHSYINGAEGASRTALYNSRTRYYRYRSN